MQWQKYTCKSSSLAGAIGYQAALRAQVTELRKEIMLALQETSDDNTVEVLHKAKAIVEGHGPGGDLRKLCKQRTPALLSLLVGARTNVVTLQASPTSFNFITATTQAAPHRCDSSGRCLQRNEAIRLKEEYHVFRDRIGWMLFITSSSLLVADYLRPHEEGLSLTPPYMVCIQVFLCWLLYVYTALALRENVLKARRSCSALPMNMHEPSVWRFPMPSTSRRALHAHCDDNASSAAWSATCKESCHTIQHARDAEEHATRWRTCRKQVASIACMDSD